MEFLRPFWEDCNWHPNVQMDLFGLVNDATGNLATPHLLVLERGGIPNGLVVGRKVRQDFRCRIGYKTFALGKVRELSILHGGVLGSAGQEEAGAVLGELTRILKHREMDLVSFNHLDTRSALFSLATRKPGVLCRDHLVTPQLHWKTQLPATPGEFLQRLNKKHRYWLRRLEKLIEKDFSGLVAFRSFADSQRLHEMMKDMECVACKTYQRRLGSGFWNNAEYARRLALEAEKGWLRAYVLYLGNRPCAFWVGRLYKNVFYSDFTGYDPEYRKYELGTLVFMKMVEELCREHAEAIDYGLGDALYKHRFGDQSWNEASVTILSPSVRGMMLNVVRTSIEAPTLCLRWFLSRVNLQQRLKTFWRRRLLRGSEE